MIHPVVTFCRVPCLKRSRALRSSTGTGVVLEPCWGSPAAQPPPFLTVAISRLVGAALENLTLVGSAFSEAGSWCRGLAAASASAAGGAAPAQTGPAASWSWTRWTAGNKHRHTSEGSAAEARLLRRTYLQAVQQHRGLLHRRLLIGPRAAGGTNLVPAAV